MKRIIIFSFIAVSALLFAALFQYITNNKFSVQTVTAFCCIYVSYSIINEKLGKNFSLALCLEDTINDDFVDEAEQILAESINKIYTQYQIKPFYLPKIFIRVRNPEQIIKLFNALKPCLNLITGFIVPKFSTSIVAIGFSTLNVAFL